jgi:Protein of unknown function (DUF4240)
MKLLLPLAVVLAVFAVFSGKGPGSLADVVKRDIAKVRSAARSVQGDIKAIRPRARALQKQKEKKISWKPAPTVSAKKPSRAASTKEAVPAAEQPTARKTAVMNEATFWQLTSEARAAAGNDTGRQSDLLKQRLAKLPPQEIVEFDRIRHRLDKAAYTWNLWAAAYVIEDGCSDDCFRDFRGYLISLGRGPYEAALRNPDSLASVAQDAENGNWENADDVAPDAYSSATGADYPLDTSDLSGNPRGKPFDENNVSALARRFPRLFARFR